MRDLPGSEIGVRSFEFSTAFVERLEKAIALDFPYTERLLRPSLNPAAVLAVFAQSLTRRAESGEPEIFLLLTKRTESLQSHQGQMAFPGGRCEPDEIACQDSLSTALRETEEEVGLSRSLVQVIGKLPELTTITNYQVTPYVAVLKVPLEEVVLTPDPNEVAETVWVPYSWLMAPNAYQKEMIRRGEISFPTHVYSFEGRRIWGATGAMIKNLLDRLERIG